MGEPHHPDERGPMSRAIRNHKLWLTVGYVGALVLLAQTYI